MPSDAAARQFAALSEELTAFRNYLTAERGMAKNTVLAYGRDLDRYAGWVANGGLADFLLPTLHDLSNYLSFLHDEQLAPPSIARHLVALKMFYRFLRLEERSSQNTVELLSSPGLLGRIPHVLSPESVEQLLAAPNAGEKIRPGRGPQPPRQSEHVTARPLPAVSHPSRSSPLFRPGTSGPESRGP